MGNRVLDQEWCVLPPTPFLCAKPRGRTLHATDVSYLSLRSGTQKPRGCTLRASTFERRYSGIGIFYIESKMVRPTSHWRVLPLVRPTSHSVRVRKNRGDAPYTLLTTSGASYLSLRSGTQKPRGRTLHAGAGASTSHSVRVRKNRVETLLFFFPST